MKQITEMDNNKKLELGIEIVAAMQASCHDWDMETGRILALEDTDMDRIPFTADEFNKLPESDKELVRRGVSFQRDRLHKQAMFAADAVLNWMQEQLTPEWIPVTDRLPETNIIHAILINGDRNKSHQIFYAGGYDNIHREWLNPFGDKIEENVTHWMPLP